jgi:hypothetical protein
MSDSGMKVVWVDEVEKPEAGGMKSAVSGQKSAVDRLVLEAESLPLNCIHVKSEVENQSPEAGGGKSKVEGQLSERGSVQQEVGSQQPAVPIQASAGSSSYWQNSTALCLVRFVVSKSS